ncbi:hypothetical protein ABZX51_008618 [Aspergillus tubingensis]
MKRRKSPDSFPRSTYDLQQPGSTVDHPAHCPRTGAITAMDKPCGYYSSLPFPSWLSSMPITPSMVRYDGSPSTTCSVSTDFSAGGVTEKNQRFGSIALGY